MQQPIADRGDFGHQPATKFGLRPYRKLFQVS